MLKACANWSSSSGACVFCGVHARSGGCGSGRVGGLVNGHPLIEEYSCMIMYRRP